MSVLVNEVLTGVYHDSVMLMRMSVELESQSGVLRAAAMMATSENVDIIKQADLFDTTVNAGPSDLLVAVRAVDEGAASNAVTKVHELLAGLIEAPAAGSREGRQPRRFASALQQMPDASLALISVPGQYAAAEAEQAIEAGLDVMIFSDNVALEDECRLKQLASEQGRLVMGPDCGTALIGGVPLGFANAVRRGDIGVISASGTGLQELSVLLTHAGAGISHGIGVGGRDLSKEVGATSTLTALDWLRDDEQTRQIVVISKPPDPAIARKVLDALSLSGKPSVACFLGDFEAGAEEQSAVTVCGRLIDTLEHLLGKPFEPLDEAVPGLHGPVDGRIHGLFAGGTLCAEAQSVLMDAGVSVSSNVPLPGARTAQPDSAGHLLLDLGADEYTRGRPHPMLEPAVRDAPLREALKDPATGVVIVDVVLGYGAHPDPAGKVASVVAEHPDMPVIASLCGTDADPQNASRQRERLESAGIVVCSSAARAAEMALKLTGAGTR